MARAAAEWHNTRVRIASQTSRAESSANPLYSSQEHETRESEGISAGSPAMTWVAGYIYIIIILKSLSSQKFGLFQYLEENRLLDFG